MTDERPTTLVIFCTRPFRLFFTHLRSPNQNERYPVDPLPMGVPIIIRDCDWTGIQVRPKVYPAQLRIWTQANVHVEPPPGAPK
jgi:hypothetical protein